jgi:succinoglycan biosynthesis protein ExoW
MFRGIMRTVAVVIPYFQRKPGLLRRALDSVAAQQMPSDVRIKIIVVDDSSPLPAEQEIQGFRLPEWCELEVVRQANGGPGAARNRGLDHIAGMEVDFVAFLDSDDSWYPRHIAAALDQLNRSDFHFANVDEDGRDLFSHAEYVKRHHGRDGSGRYHPPARVISGHEAFHALLHQCFISTSQVVYDFRKHARLRFSFDQRHAGEDLLFWLELSSACEAVSYSATPMGARGWGVSLYRDSLSWDSPAALDNIIDGLKLQKKVAHFPVDAAAKAMLKRKRWRMRDRLTVLLLREMRSRPVLAAKAIRRLATELPSYFVYVPVSLVRVPSHLRMTRLKAAAEASGVPAG